MKIYDCTIFFDEKMMFDLRLNILNDYVDKFVVAESLYTHSGNPKKQNFNINDYPKFKDKIIYILVESEPDDLYETGPDADDRVGRIRLNSLKRIRKQYNALVEGITDASESDFILLSDCDEIPNLENLKKESLNNEIVLFNQKIFYYKFNLQHTSLNWFGTKGCKKKKLRTFECPGVIVAGHGPFCWGESYDSAVNYSEMLEFIAEVAYFSEKMDVTEEIVRCNSHFTQLLSYLDVNEPVGKRINFLLQEIGREINTIGSKSPQADLTIDIVEIKDELEKIREQIQNIL